MFWFPITRSPDAPITRSFFGPSAYVPSARDSTPHSVLLKTKAKVQFDRTVTDRSKPFFARFTLPNRCHFAGLFALVTLCRRIDRQWVVGDFHLPNYQITHLLNSAEIRRNPATCSHFLFIKELRWGPRTLGRWQILGDF
jgi:hypothetical protein